MAARRLLTLLLLLLVVSTLAATLVPSQDERDGTTSSIERSGEDDRAERGAPAPKQLTRTIDASTRGIERIELRLGDQLALTVRSGTADQVEIPALGQLEDVDSDAPARFDLLPQRPGAFEVRLLDARRTVARITVRGR
jgi:hypothetical protein